MIRSIYLFVDSNYVSNKNLDSFFSNNKWLNTFSVNSTVNDTGLGTISFFGRSLTIDSTVFVNNFNSKAGGIYIDGYSDVFNLTVTLTNILFENNSVLASGGAFYVGAGLLSLNGIFQNITCRNNSAALRIFFEVS